MRVVSGHATSGRKVIKKCFLASFLVHDGVMQNILESFNENPSKYNSGEL